MKRILIIALTFCLCACGDKEEREQTLIDGSAFSKNYVQVYLLVEEFELVSSAEENRMKPSFIGERLMSTGTTSYRHSIYAERYGDTYFNRKIVPFCFTIIANEFTSVCISSNADFDETHPAGTPLNDIVRFCAASPLKFIESGYIDWFDWRNKPDDYAGDYFYSSAGFHPVNMLVSELTPDDLMMLDLYNLHFRIMVVPEIKEHTITVTFMEGEKKFETQVDMIYK